MTTEEEAKAAEELRKEAVRLAWIFLWIFGGSFIATVLAGGILCHFQAGFLALLWAIAFSAVGICGGFLFGIPKTVQFDQATQSRGAEARKANWARRADYRSVVNNNLVDISDWLTKIIVGLGLVNLNKIPALIIKVAHVLSDSLEKCGTCGCSDYLAFSAGLVIGFLSLGFLFGYLFTRLYLATAFIRADLAGLAQATEGEKDRPADVPLPPDEKIAEGGETPSVVTQEKTTDETKSGTATAAEAAPASTARKPTSPLMVFPDPTALTKEERKMLKTLWPHQRSYMLKNENKLWGFTISEAAPDYPEFMLGYGNLSQRGFVSQGDKGLVFLTDVGINYCKLYQDRLLMPGEAWTNFSPA